jgi:hypothetical protein
MDNNPAPITLAYETPPPDANAFARTTPLPAVLLLAILVPGLSSSLIRRKVWWCLCLAPVIPLAFLFFGPVWGEVLFRSSSTQWREFGVYPFLLTCVIVEITSLLLALAHRHRALRHVSLMP